MRRRRLDPPDLPLHITHRGVNRSDVFFDDGDRHEYLLSLHKGLASGEARLHGYVLMRNHVHLLAAAVVPGGVSRLMQAVGRRYVRRVNLRLGRTGSLWEGRFKSFPVDSDRYLLNCLAYIELNPVRAGLVPRPEQHAWSSVHQHLGLRDEPWLQPHPVFAALAATAKLRADAWRACLMASLRPEEIDAIRRHSHGERPWGGEAFKQRVAALTGQPVEPRGRGRPPTRASNANVL
jgi:putative transposase